jgi:hypothetical protein
VNLDVEVIVGGERHPMTVPDADRHPAGQVAQGLAGALVTQQAAAQPHVLYSERLARYVPGEVPLVVCGVAPGDVLHLMRAPDPVPVPGPPPAAPGRGPMRATMVALVVAALILGGAAVAIALVLRSGGSGGGSSHARAGVSATKGSAPVAPRAPGGSTRYIAQLASFRGRANAQTEADRLAANGVHAKVLDSDDYPDVLRPNYYVVYAGFFDSKRAAAAAARQARGAGSTDAFARPITSG